jgi:hypothetical protein
MGRHRKHRTAKPDENLSSPVNDTEIPTETYICVENNSDDPNIDMRAILKNPNESPIPDLIHMGDSDNRKTMAHSMVNMLGDIMGGKSSESIEEIIEEDIDVVISPQMEGIVYVLFSMARNGVISTSSYISAIRTHFEIDTGKMLKVSQIMRLSTYPGVIAYGAKVRPNIEKIENRRKKFDLEALEAKMYANQ